MNVIVLGASSNPERYSYKAVVKFKSKGYTVFPVGKKKGTIEEMEILASPPEDINVDIVSIYLNKQNQLPYYDYLMNLKPGFVIFNPGTENSELEEMLTLEGVKTEEACSLVLLSIREL